MLCFEALQFPDQAVVLGIRDLDVIQRVVSIIVIPNFLTQRFDFIADVRH